MSPKSRVLTILQWFLIERARFLDVFMYPVRCRVTDSRLSKLSRLRGDESGRLLRMQRVGQSALQITSDFGELGKGGLQVFDNFLSDNIGIGKVGAVFEAFVFEPEDVEVELVALE